MKGIVLFLLVFSTAFIFPQEVLISTFDQDSESWAVNGGIMYYHSTEGNPGGFIEFEDDQDGAGIFIAPGKFLGDIRGYNQGILSFDLKNTNDNGQDSLYGYGNIRITSSNSSAQKNVVPLGYIEEWTAFSIPLTSETWGVTESGWDSLLSDVIEISIQMDAQWNYFDRSGLDNFALSPYTTGMDHLPIEEVDLNYRLNQNYPNPFNPTTTISWQVPAAGWQTLKIYDVLGKEIATLVNEERPAGSYKMSFDASDLTSGIYFYKIQIGSYIQVKKMVLLK